MTQYAKNTGVSVENSRAEIERTLRRYKASAFAYAQSEGQAMVAFEAFGRRVRFVLLLPDPNSREFTHHSRGTRSQSAAEAAWEQACRQKWRALALAIKAKLESVESEIATFDDEFLAYIVLPDGATVGEWAKPQVEKVYQLGTGSLPALMPGGPAGR